MDLKFPFYLFILGLADTFLIALCDGKENGKREGTLLCKKCGHEIGQTSDILNVLGTNVQRRAVKKFTDKSLALLQYFTNPHHQQFGIITMKNPSLYVHKQVIMDDSWFQNHAWSMCTCPHCTTHLGWWYQPVGEDLESSFYGVVLDKIIEESKADAVVRLPPAFQRS